jgi:hypothetical protein
MQPGGRGWFRIDGIGPAGGGGRRPCRNRPGPRVFVQGPGVLGQVPAGIDAAAIAAADGLSEV